MQRALEAASLPVFHTKITCVRVFWVVIIGMTIGGMIYQMYYTIDQFRRQPRATNMLLEPLDEFPSVTLCLHEFVDPRRAVDLGFTGPALAHALSILEKPFTALTEQITDVNQTHVEWFNNVALSQFSSYSALLRSLSFDISERAKVKCKFCTNATLATTIIKKHGVCHRFDPGKLENITVRGSFNVEFLIQLEDLSQSEDILDASLQLGYNMTVDDDDKKRKKREDKLELRKKRQRNRRNANETATSTKINEVVGCEEEYQTYGFYFGEDARYFDPVNLLELRTEHNYFVFLTVERVRRLAGTEGCRNDLDGAQYRPCQRTCQNEYISECGLNCTAYAGEAVDMELTVSANNSTVTYCKQAELEAHEDCLSEKAGTHICEALCGLSCEETVYKFSILPFEAEGGDIQITVRLMQAGTVRVFKEVETYSWYSFLGNMGGMMGMFSGASILTIAHLIVEMIVVPIEKKMKK